MRVYCTFIYIYIRIFITFYDMNKSRVEFSIDSPTFAVSRAPHAARLPRRRSRTTCGGQVGSAIGSIGRLMACLDTL